MKKSLKTLFALLGIFFIILAISLAVVVSILSYKNNSQPKNVFVEMIYVRKNDTRWGNGFEYFGDSKSMVTMNGDKYGEEYLEKNEEIIVTWKRQIIGTDSINIVFRKILESDSKAEIFSYFTVSFQYNAFTKELTYKPVEVYYKNNEEYQSVSSEKEDVLFVMEKYNLTREDIIDYQNYVLYDVLLPYWFNTNTGTSQFSMDNLGEFTIVDNTFQNLD